MRSYNQPNALPRLIVIDGSALGIKTYGADNGYPQRMLNLYNASGSAKMCANLCARYIIGKGFEDLKFYKTIIGRQDDEDLTPDKLLRMLAADKARFRGFAIHLNYNALYQVETIAYVPFEHCRKGAHDNLGKVAVYKDWFNTGTYGRYRRKDKIDFIDRYNPDPLVIQQQVNDSGGWDEYKGQILYKSDDFGTVYPLSTIDQVLNDVEAEINSANTRKNNLLNNFQLKKVYVVKGQNQDEEQDLQEVENVKRFMGPDGSPVNVVFSEDPEGKDIPEIIDVKSDLNDKLFQYTDQTARLCIYTAFGQPAILHSDYQGTNGYNEGQLPQSQQYYNSFTEPDRMLMTEVFTEIFSRYKDPINPSGNYEIIPIQTLVANPEVKPTIIQDDSIINQ